MKKLFRVDKVITTNTVYGFLAHPVLFLWIQKRVEMFWMKSALSSLVLVTCVIALSSALKCYKCTSKQHAACGYPFSTEKASELNTCEGDYSCRKYLERGGLGNIF